MLAIIAVAVLALAFANGANDNSKGVAALYGSGTASFRMSIGWATVTTFIGSTFALLLSGRLAATFSGRGIVPDDVARDPRFIGAVLLGAALTVLLASRLGAPVSTTHALVGALVGAGLAHAGGAVSFGALGRVALLPLLASPLLAASIAGPLYLVFRWGRRRAGIDKESCVCVGSALVPVRAAAGPTARGAPIPSPILLGRAGACPPPLTASRSGCRDRYVGTMAGIDAQRILEALHFLSAGAMSLARGLNDTPKIAAGLLAMAALPPAGAVLCVAAAMALGGLVFARRVGETMGHGVATMNDGQGFTASLVTTALVMTASLGGFAVSTTHVSVGSIAGMGAAAGRARWRGLRDVTLAWLLTLPLSAALAYVAALLLGRP